MLPGAGAGAGAGADQKCHGSASLILVTKEKVGISSNSNIQKQYRTGRQVWKCAAPRDSLSTDRWAPRHPEVPSPVREVRQTGTHRALTCPLQGVSLAKSLSLLKHCLSQPADLQLPVSARYLLVFGRCFLTPAPIHHARMI